MLPVARYITGIFFLVCLLCPQLLLIYRSQCNVTHLLLLCLHTAPDLQPHTEAYAALCGDSRGVAVEDLGNKRVLYWEAGFMVQSV